MSCGRPGDVATCDERRQRATSPQEERRYLLAPADSPDVAVVLAHLDRALDGDVRTQDAPILVATLMRNRKAGPQVWRAVTQRWDELVERFAERAHVLMVTAVATFASDPALAAEVRRFHEAHTEAAYERRVAQVLDLMDVNVAVAQRSAGTLATTLREFAR